jgi:hypothetical protein
MEKILICKKKLWYSSNKDSRWPTWDPNSDDKVVFRTLMPAVDWFI